MAALRPAIADIHNRDPKAGLDGEPLPALLIDAEASEIVAANAPGAEALGLFSYASFPIALDPAMPVLQKLRAFISRPGERQSLETLTFDINGKSKRLTCSVARRDEAHPALLLVRIAPPEAARAMPRSGRAGSAEAQPAPDAAGLSPPAVAPLRKALSVLDPDHLAKLAHELKTPLSAIIAAAEIMRDERLGAMGNPRYLSYAADIHESATHALDVITSLLSESGSPSAVVARLIALDLNAIVERTVSSVQALAQSQGLVLSFDAEKSRPHVVANPTALRQILLNLLTNAIKFTPRGGTIGVETGYLEDGRVFLAVRDTGRGMIDGARGGSPAASSGETPVPGRGKGIGLPLVRRLARDIGAEFEIESAPGKGTRALIAFGDFARWSA